MSDRSSATSGAWRTLRADVDTWEFMGSMNGKYPIPPVWWNACEGCGRHIDEGEEIGVQVVMGGLPNAVFCLNCKDKPPASGYSS